MDILSIAAFCKPANHSNIESLKYQLTGGNPAGVVIVSEFPDARIMLDIAQELGYSETVFAVPISKTSAKPEHFRVRYFSPLREVPFCGHATLALGSALALRFGNNTFNLQLTDSVISVEGRVHKIKQQPVVKSRELEDYQNDAILLSASLTSPATSSYILQNNLTDQRLLSEAFELFNYDISQLNKSVPPAIIQAGATHLVLTLKSLDDLDKMDYCLTKGREWMIKHDLITVMFVYVANDNEFIVRNAFAIGGVKEDPATGAAAAAFAGYLRDIDWPHQGQATFYQGGHIDMPSLIQAEIAPESGSPIKLIGAARLLD